MKAYPGLELVYRDIAVDSASAGRLSRIVEQHQTMAASVPVFHVADKLLVGFENENSTDVPFSEKLPAQVTSEVPDPRTSVE